MASSRGDAHEDTEHGATPGSSDLDTAGGDAAPARAASVESLPRGAIIGRYVLLHQLGRGGMGVVYSAYDPELDRKIAVKVLHPVAAKTGLEGAVRLVREAQAMARIKHANVVTVHDVGQEGGVVYVAMEFVEGHTLKRWLRTAPRSRAEILAVFLLAGEGLAAAHDRGLVHRDFKPENVMVEESGRVVVLDFGVAYAAVAEATPGVDGSASSSTALGHVDADRTAAGTLIGTPAYMAAEQFSGGTADARADQFAFCVALWEALTGTRPFRGDTPPELAVSVMGNHLVEPPRDADFPAWLRRVLVRGLRSDRNERWPAMAELLAALRDDPTLRRRRLVLGALALAVLGAGAGAALLANESNAAACERAGDLSDVWNDDVRAQVEARMLATSSPYGAEAFAKSMPWLDTWTVAWSSAKVDACRAELDAHDPTIAAAVATCLDERRSAFVEAVAALGETTLDDLQHAVPLVAGLPSVQRCSDRAWLLTRPTPPDDPVAREQIAAAREQLDRADALVGQGRYADAVAIVRDAIDSAGVGISPSLRARAQTSLGEALYDEADYEASREALVEGFFVATQARDVDAAARAANALLLTTGDGLGRFDEAAIWARLAEAQLAGGADPLERISLLSNRVAVSLLQGHIEPAFEQADEALRLTRETYGDDHPETLFIRINRAAALDHLARLQEAEAELRACLVDIDRVLGSGHPEIAAVHNNLAAVLASAERFDEAEVEARAAVELARSTLGPSHPNTATTLNGLASVLESTGRYEEAEGVFRSVVDVWTRSFGPRHPNVVLARSNLGHTLISQGRLDAAKVEFDETIAISVADLGEDHPNVAGLREKLAAVLQLEGKREESLAEYRKVFEARSRTLPADHPEIAFSATNLARALLALDRRDEALPLLEQAWAALHRVEATPLELATTGWFLAQTMPAGSRAIAIAEEAERAFEAAGDTKHARTVEEWLAARGAPPRDPGATDRRAHD